MGIIGFPILSETPSWFLHVFETFLILILPIFSKKKNGNFRGNLKVGYDTWHQSYDAMDKVMVHPFNGET
jgi:hypothetical protein